MFKSKTDYCSVALYAPFLAFIVLSAFASGCGGGPEVDPNIKIEKGKELDESVKGQQARPGAVKQEPAPKQRTGGGPPE